MRCSLRSSKAVQQRRCNSGRGVEQTLIGELSLGIDDSRALCMHRGTRNQWQVSGCILHK